MSSKYTRLLSVDMREWQLVMRGTCLHVCLHHVACGTTRVSTHEDRQLLWARKSRSDVRDFRTKLCGIAHGTHEHARDALMF